MSYRHCDGIEFLRSLPAKSVDGIFTDPPWGRRKSKRGEMRGPKIHGQENWLKLISAMDRECPRILKPQARVLVWIGVRMISDLLRQIKKLEYKWSIYCAFMPPRYVACFESYIDPILYFSLPGEPFPNRGAGRKIRQLYEKWSTGRKDTIHPCARPFSVVKNILNDWFYEGEYVIDPFAGSDTAGVACRELNLKYDTCEIDPLMYVTGKTRHSQKYLFEER